MMRIQPAYRTSFSDAFLLLLSFALLSCVGHRAIAESGKKPDIILIVGDNLGHGDLSCYGCPDIHTPNIDVSPQRASDLQTSMRTGLSVLPREQLY